MLFLWFDNPLIEAWLERRLARSANATSDAGVEEDPSRLPRRARSGRPRSTRARRDAETGQHSRRDDLALAARTDRQKAPSRFLIAWLHAKPLTRVVHRHLPFPRDDPGVLQPLAELPPSPFDRPSRRRQRVWLESPSRLLTSPPRNSTPRPSKPSGNDRRSPRRRRRRATPTKLHLRGNHSQFQRGRHSHVCECPSRGRQHRG